MAKSSTLPPLVRGQWIPMTYEEFLAWAPDGLRTEWTDGEGILYLSASDRHQAVIELVLALLSSFVRLTGAGRVSFAPFAMLLAPGGPHREPDVLFVRTEHLDRWTTQRLHGPADLVVEVLSEDTAREDLGRKREQYAALGVSEYVVIDARPGRQEFAYLQLDEAGRYQPLAPDGQGRFHSTALPVSGSTRPGSAKTPCRTSRTSSWSWRPTPIGRGCSPSAAPGARQPRRRKDQRS